MTTTTKINRETHTALKMRPHRTHGRVRVFTSEQEKDRHTENRHHVSPVRLISSLFDLRNVFNVTTP